MFKPFSTFIFITKELLQKVNYPPLIHSRALLSSSEETAASHRTAEYLGLAFETAVFTQVTVLFPPLCLIHFPCVVNGKYFICILKYSINLTCYNLCSQEKKQNKTHFMCSHMDKLYLQGTEISALKY